MCLLSVMFWSQLIKSRRPQQELHAEKDCLATFSAPILDTPSDTATLSSIQQEESPVRTAEPVCSHDPSRTLPPNTKFSSFSSAMA